MGDTVKQTFKHPLPPKGIQELHNQALTAPSINSLIQHAWKMSKPYPQKPPKADVLPGERCFAPSALLSLKLTASPHCHLSPVGNRHITSILRAAPTLSMLPLGWGFGRAAPQPAHKTQLLLPFWLPSEQLWFTALCKWDPIKTTVGSIAKQNAFKAGESKSIKSFQQAPFGREKGTAHGAGLFSKEQPRTEVL